jgi:hypothetical protein
MLRLVFQHSLYNTFYGVWVSVTANARAHGRHGIPISDVDQHTFNVRPLPAHVRFNRVDPTPFVPKDTVAIGLLRQKAFSARKRAISGFKRAWIHIKVCGNGGDICFGYVGSAVTLAAIAAHPAFKNPVGPAFI